MGILEHISGSSSPSGTSPPASCGRTTSEPCATAHNKLLGVPGGCIALHKLRQVGGDTCAWEEDPHAGHSCAQLVAGHDE